MPRRKLTINYFARGWFAYMHGKERGDCPLHVETGWLFGWSPRERWLAGWDECQKDTANGLVV
jgi:ribosome modulation factor